MANRRALLLTDVVDSTQLSEALGDVRMAALWAAHDRVARDLLPLHNGREIDKTDGFLLLFESAADAVAYALAYHRALIALDPPVKARAGLHIGDVILTRNSPQDIAQGAKPLEVDGIAKPTAARIMGLATGGQTLLSPTAYQDLGPTDHKVLSHGHWRMKGVSEPVELFEIGDEDAPFRPPPDAAKVYRVVQQGDLWIPVKEIPNSLPAERDSFVGRSADLQAIGDTFDAGARLVSVLGMGGTGKTRLVQRYGWTWLGSYPGGVWFCDLSEARALPDISYALARSLDVDLQGQPVEQLGLVLARRGRCLVVLDNFEQVAGYASDSLGHWLDAAGHARFLVTSREVLGLAGEAVLPLSPMPAPAAVQLFESRASAVKAGFEVNEGNRDDVQALVKLLDHLPLAIELAAARARMLSPKKLLARMGRRFDLLASRGGRRDRQATLRATLDWSWDLLTEAERSALAQLSVFEGGFDLDAAEGVLDLDAFDDAPWPMDAVQSLVDKSLVRVDGEDRFDLLVSVQEYAQARLTDSGGVGEAQARHGAWFAEFGTPEAVDALDQHGGVERRKQLAPDLENLVVACRRAIREQSARVAAHTVLAAWGILLMRAPARAAELALQVLELPLDPVNRIKVSCVAAYALRMAGQPERQAALVEPALELARQLGDRVLEGRASGALASVRRIEGDTAQAQVLAASALAIAREHRDGIGEASQLYCLAGISQALGRMSEAEERLLAALEMARKVGNRRYESYALNSLGTVYTTQGRLDDASRLLHQALQVHHQLGAQRSAAMTRTNLARVHYYQGDAGAALAAFEQALTDHRRVGNAKSEATVLTNLAVLHSQGGRLSEAAECAQQTLVIYQKLGHTLGEAIALNTLSGIQLGLSDPEGAERSLRSAIDLARACGSPNALGVVLTSLGDLQLGKGALAEARVLLDEAADVLVDVEPLEYIRLLSCQVRLEHAEGHADRALARLDQAQSCAEQAGLAPDSPYRGFVDRARLVLQGGPADG